MWVTQDVWTEDRRYIKGEVDPYLAERESAVVGVIEAVHGRQARRQDIHHAHLKTVHQNQDPQV